jgi:hypothetical protein
VPTANPPPLSLSCPCRWSPLSGSGPRPCRVAAWVHGRHSGAGWWAWPVLPDVHLGGSSGAQRCPLPRQCIPVLLRLVRCHSGLWSGAGSPGPRLRLLSAALCGWLRVPVPVWSWFLRFWACDGVLDLASLVHGAVFVRASICSAWAFPVRALVLFSYFHHLSLQYYILNNVIIDQTTTVQDVKRMCLQVSGCILSWCPCSCDVRICICDQSGLS